ncbi:hypothetical protein [Brevibacillus daliensis]|uniref:hypothetical protein n=1 Tax=Brevibacillus daliensis TaxID=2892995 RepID=UPI001E358C20|nr:hypothetical protein [Brevibacillus daliensis]
MKWKIAVPVVLVAILAIGYFIYQQQKVSPFHDPAEVVNKFELAVKEGNVKQFLELTTIPDDVKGKTALHEKNAANILATLKEYQETFATYMEDMKDQARYYQQNETYVPEALTDEKVASALLVLKKEGKIYKVQVRPSYVTVTGPVGTKLTTGESGVEIKLQATEKPATEQTTKPIEAGQVPGVDTFLVGPYFPGEYTLNGSFSTMLGTVSAETKLTVMYGLSKPVTVEFPIRDIKIYTNLKQAILFHKGQQLPVTFEQSFNGVVTTIHNVPAEDLEFTVKATTAQGELSETGTILKSEEFVDLPFTVSKADGLKEEIVTLFSDYNKAWLTYARKKESLDPLRPYLHPEGFELTSYEREIAQFKESPAIFKDVFAGDTIRLEVDFGTLQTKEDGSLTILVLEVYEDRWKNLELNKVSDHGEDIQCWEYTLKKYNDKWLVVESRADSPDRFGLNSDDVYKIK